MAKQNRLLRRGAVYYFRCRIPKDLLDYYAPKQEAVYSLRTKDFQQAEKLARVESVKWDAEFERIRHARTLELSAFTDETATQLAEAWAASCLADDEYLREVQTLTDDEYDELEWVYAKVEGVSKKSLATGRPEQEVVVNGRRVIFGVLQGMEQFLDNNGYPIPPRDSLEYRRLLKAFTKADARIIALVRKRHQGEIIETPEAPPIVARPDGGTLRAVFDKWKLERQPKPKTAHEFGLVVSRFENLHGKSLRLDAITKTHVIQFKDHLLGVGKSAGTITKQLGALKTVLGYAVDNDLLDSNPATKVRLAKAKVEKEKRLPYSIDDLNAIFRSPVYTESKRPKGGAGETAYWLPLLALFTGARRDELCQARLSDIREQEGITFIELSDRADNASVKTVTSRRRVPIHDELVKCGFLAYVEKLRARGEAQLFPELRPNNRGEWGAAWSKWWGRYARETVGIVDSRKVFHSFRHTFKDACRECGIDEAVHDALTGHAGGGVGRSYGGLNYPLTPLQQAIKKLRYPGLAIPHLHHQAAS